jgi:cytochrome c-type biogenesis protein CcmF
MLAAHAGLCVFVFGVTQANGFEARRELRLEPGERVAVGGFDFAFQGTVPSAGPNYDAQRATLVVSRRGQPVATLHPEKRRYRAQDTALSQAAIDVGLARDLFVALGEPVGPGAWTLRLQVKPFMAWLWAGCALVALGGLLAATDRRYRLGRAGRAAAAEGGVPAGAVAIGAVPREGA